MKRIEWKTKKVRHHLLFHLDIGRLLQTLIHPSRLSHLHCSSLTFPTNPNKSIYYGCTLHIILLWVVLILKKLPFVYFVQISCISLFSSLLCYTYFFLLIILLPTNNYKNPNTTTNTTNTSNFRHKHFNITTTYSFYMNIIILDLIKIL